jgi:hypothetical protein
VTHPIGGRIEIVQRAANFVLVQHQRAGLPGARAHHLDELWAGADLVGGYSDRLVAS